LKDIGKSSSAFPLLPFPFREKGEVVEFSSFYQTKKTCQRFLL